MNSITNASLYLTRYPSDLAKVLPHAKSDAGLLRKQTRVDFIIARQAISFTFMPKAEMEEHLRGLAGFMKHLKDQQVNPASQIRTAMEIIPKIKCVLGGQFSRPFEFQSEVTQMLFVVAHHYQGYVFMLNSMFASDMTTVCGPTTISAGA
jgi:hypothetical protein